MQRLLVDRNSNFGGFFFGEGSSIANLQRANVDIPPGSLQIPEAERGIAFPAKAGASASFELHHFNASNETILREVWMNLWWMPEDEVERSAAESFHFSNVNYPPGQVTDASGQVTATGETQLLSLFGHRHAWTTRFHVWLTRSGSSEEELLCDSYNWLDVPTYAYNDITANPQPNPNLRVDGGYSGALTLQEGDTLHFNCHAEVTQERAAQLGVPLPTAPLRFANEAFDAEMCVMTAVSTGTPLSMFPGF